MCGKGCHSIFLCACTHFFKTVLQNCIKFGVTVAANSGYLVLDFGVCSSFGLGVVSVYLLPCRFTCMAKVVTPTCTLYSCMEEVF